MSGTDLQGVWWVVEPDLLKALLTGERERERGAESQGNQGNHLNHHPSNNKHNKAALYLFTTSTHRLAASTACPD